MSCSFPVEWPVVQGAIPLYLTGVQLPSAESIGSSRCSSSGDLLAADESEQAGVVLGAGRAAFEMGPEPGNCGLLVDAGQLRLDVAVELLEALLAGELGATGSKQPSECPVEIAPVHHRVSSRVRRLGPIARGPRAA